MCGRFLLLPDEDNIELFGILESIGRKFPGEESFTCGEMFPGGRIPALTGPSDEADIRELVFLPEESSKSGKTGEAGEAGESGKAGP